MCGIVLAGGNLVSTEVEAFNQLLYADVFRGVHATGVFAKRMKEGIVTAKDAVPSFKFIDSPEYRAVVAGTDKTAIAPAFIVGHNRHATRGNANDPKNAHPFRHGNITLVHNGTLVDQSLLPNHTYFEVDSDNICYSIDRIGAAETIQRLDGAFTLIWHDASDETVHIIRNDERPFHLAKCGLDWFGASEEDMLMWIIRRNRSLKNRNIEHFECEVGVEYIFDVSGNIKRFTLKEQIKHTLPTFGFKTTNWGKYYGGYQTTNQKSYPSDSQKANERANQNAIAVKNNLSVRIDDRITFSPMAFTQYATPTQDKGKLTGWYMDNDLEYVEVDAHAISKALYEDSLRDVLTTLTGTVKNIIEIKGKVRLIVTGVSIVSNKITDQELTELNDDIPFEHETSKDSFTTITGREITKTFWHQHDHGVCMGCNKLIDWKDAPKAAFAYQGFWHPECLARTEEAENQLKAQEAQSNDTFICACCGEEKSMSYLDSDMSVRRDEDVCSSCSSKINKNPPPEPKEIEYIAADYEVFDGKGVIVRNRIFSRSEFSKMVSARGSDIIKFEDLKKAKITQRSPRVYVYFYKKGGSAEEGASFQRPALSKEISGTKDGEKHSVTKALWNHIGFCCGCYSTIPWKDVESCVINEQKRVVCKDCKGE